METSDPDRIPVNITDAKLKLFFNVLDNIRAQKNCHDDETFDMEIDLFSRFFKIEIKISTPLLISRNLSQENEDKEKRESERKKLSQNIDFYSLRNLMLNHCQMRF